MKFGVRGHRYGIGDARSVAESWVPTMTTPPLSVIDLSADGARREP
ncbi:hypothetical protein [Streptomyces sp. KR80]